MFKGPLFFILLFCTGSLALAQSFRWDTEWYNSAQAVDQNKNNIIDPTGRRLDSARARLETDLRINTKYTWQSGTRFIFRPRLLGDMNQYHYLDTNETKTTNTGKASLSEAYLEGNPLPPIALSIGLQNYQWGPAEFISPTNTFFRFRAGQRAYNFKEDGRFFLRMNWSPKADWSVIAIAEPINNGNSFWIYEQTFKPKSLIKFEYRGQNSLNYFGFDVGTIDDFVPFIGEYFNYEVLQGFSIYLDARHSNGFAQYEPEISSDGLYDMVYVRNAQAWRSLLVTGVRWESRVDIRAEYIYNSYGLNKDQMLTAFQSAVPQHPRGDENLKKLMGSGMEILGQHYAYISFRVPDLFVQNNNLALRYLRSLMDQSATIQLAADTAVGSAWTLFEEANFSVGDSTQELSALEKASGQIGVKWNF